MVGNNKFHGVALSELYVKVEKGEREERREVGCTTFTTRSIIHELQKDFRRKESGSSINDR
jgi:hypothetical protein